MQAWTLPVEQSCALGSHHARWQQGRARALLAEGSSPLPGQVLNQTLRIEMQLQEHSLSTTQLEKQLLLQTNEIHKLQNRNK